MADRTIDQLNAAEKIYATDLFVLQQSGSAKKLSGQVLLNWLTDAADGHGGIQSIEKLSTIGLVDTYRITLADTETFDFDVKNGRGITFISKISTSGLVDTYKIMYNDGRHDTLTVTNGERGEKGEKGNTGAPAKLMNTEIVYQSSDSGTIIPTGAWSTSIPVVAQGKYLWKRTTRKFNSGEPEVSYDVNRMGIDGSGNVSFVNGVRPDESGNVTLTAADVGALAVIRNSEISTADENGRINIGSLDELTALFREMVLEHMNEIDVMTVVITYEDEKSHGSAMLTVYKGWNGDYLPDAVALLQCADGRLLTAYAFSEGYNDAEGVWEWYFDGQWKQRIETVTEAQIAEYLAENPPLTVQLTFGADFEGKTYTITGGANETYTGTVPADLTVTRTVKTLNSEYVVTSTNADGITYDRTVTIGSYYGVYRSKFESFRAYLACTADPGSTVTATNGTKTYSGTADSGGKVILNIYATGTYSVTASMDGSTTDAVTVEVTETGATYTCKVPSLFYPEIVSWAEGTDEQIAAMVAALDAGTISIEDTGWAVGDERVVTLSAMAATGVDETHAEQTVTLVLMDSQHYTLTNPTAGGDTKDHFVVGLKNTLNEYGYMNSSNTNSGSWSGCARRTWCNEVFRAAIPETLRGCFKQFKVPTATTYNGSSVTETDDYFALFAEKEIFGSRTYSNTTEANALSQIKWYETAANRIKKGSDAKYDNSWWERSPYSDTIYSFCSIGSDGNASIITASYDNIYIAPFGCI